MALLQTSKRKVERFGAPLFTSWQNPPWDHPILLNPYYRPPIRFQANDPALPTDIYAMPPGVTATQPASGSATDYCIALATNIAKILEYLGYRRGTGSDPSGNHEGCILLQHWMENYTPLEALFQSDKDILTGSALSATNYPTDSWFTAEAVTSIRANETTPFLTTLRDECDARNICYPLRFHCDIEEFDFTTWTDTGTKGWLQAAALDPRWSTEEVLPGLTSEKLIARITEEGFAYDPSRNWAQGDNLKASLDFMVGLHSSVFSYALYKAFDSLLQPIFRSSGCLTSNWFFGAADGDIPIRSYNSPNFIISKHQPTYQSMASYAAYPYVESAKLSSESYYTYFRRMAPNVIKAALASSDKSAYRALWFIYPGTELHSYTPTTDDCLWLWDVAYRAGFTDFIGWNGVAPDWDLYNWTIDRFVTDYLQIESARTTSLFGRLERGFQRVQP